MIPFVNTAAAGAFSSTTVPAGWTPLSITSASVVGFLDFENNAKITATGGKIASITDSGSSAAVLAQVSAALQPTVTTSVDSGRQVGVFDGVGTYLEIASIPTGWPTGATAGGFAVVCNQTDTGSGTRFSFGYGGASATTHRAVQKAGNVDVGTAVARAFVGDGTSKSADATGTIFYGRKTIVVTIDGTNFTCAADAAPGAPTASVPATGINRARVGCGASTSPGNYWQGEISAIIVWSGTLSATELGYLYYWGSARLGYRELP